MVGYRVRTKHYNFICTGEQRSRGSEHTMNGAHYAAEMHIVHYDFINYPSIPQAVEAKDGLAVLGVFVKLGRYNPAWEPVIREVHRIRHTHDPHTFDRPFSLMSLLPDDLTRFYRYRGSLTTPGCHESVVWTVFEKPIELSRHQIGQFRRLSDLSGADSHDKGHHDTDPLTLEHSHHKKGSAQDSVDASHNTTTNTKQTYRRLTNNYRYIQHLFNRKVYQSWPHAANTAQAMPTAQESLNVEHGSRNHHSNSAHNNSHVVNGHSGVPDPHHSDSSQAHHSNSPQTVNENSGKPAAHHDNSHHDNSHHDNSHHAHHDNSHHAHHSNSHHAHHSNSHHAHHSNSHHAHDCDLHHSNSHHDHQSNSPQDNSPQGNSPVVNEHSSMTQPSHVDQVGSGGAHNNSPQDNSPPDNSQDNLPEDNLPEDNLPEDNSPQDNSPPDNVPQDNSPPDNVPQDNSPQDNSPPDNVPQDNSPPDNVPQDNSPQDNSPPDNLPQDNSPPDNLPPDNSSR
ncbi:uncharacterized protein [Amphiura filiformis]|uniref:uncharacterized protein n=1 Tax=Amphiura filiformis TaxID=82378 RepID=UPI003B217529